MTHSAQMFRLVPGRQLGAFFFASLAARTLLRIAAVIRIGPGLVRIASDSRLSLAVANQIIRKMVDLVDPMVWNDVRKAMSLEDVLQVRTDGFGEPPEHRQSWVVRLIQELPRCPACCSRLVAHVLPEFFQGQAGLREQLAGFQHRVVGAGRVHASSL